MSLSLLVSSTVTELINMFVCVRYSQTLLLYEKGIHYILVLLFEPITSNVLFKFTGM